ncbi:Vancomycin resistance protein YoaR, contains peptidoglycan-binding and VanW domains [Gracilibacillus ureilyticus]|uniref:Vancomycin resistance protein YoaR, contains peptidoglycan-binding and VanW domains n=1 Tax=Gracilibacillus ureilyticus TaxID=531814 RepID=A0A1H9TUX8_9BACI|nr:VanW family protein [Gracilibacillus ureilyticus]SES01035.1 Vancomycin resistance protein YoaR, contains peptidoglycan-binding and VanW domains [Gracilibacillus ureilyticus]
MKIIGLTFFLLLLNQLNVFADTSDLVVTYKGKPIASVSRAELRVLFFEEPVVDEDKYRMFIEELKQKVYQEPVDATIDDNGAIIPGNAGYKIDPIKFKELFYSYFFSDQSARIEVPTMEIHSNVDSELLANIRTQQVGHYVTYFNSNNEERSHNIFLASEAINNHVVFPGKTFSFNEVVGKRTEEKGYLPAPEIVEGELTEGIGGGICQVSSTLYNAVDRAGVEMVERYSHSKKVPYVPPGRDATVSWYGPDFTFKNNLNQPLLIRSKVKEGKVMIEIYSSDQVEYTPREVPNAS